MPPPWMDEHEWDVQFFYATTGKPYPPGYQEFLEKHPLLHLLGVILALLLCCCETILEVREHRRRRAAMDHED